MIIPFHIDWMFTSLPSKFTCWNLPPCMMAFEGQTFGRWLGHNDGALMKWMSDLINETLGNSLAPSTCEDPARRQPPVNQDVGSCHWTCWCLELEFPASRTVRNKLVLFISHLVRGVLLLLCEWTKIYVSQNFKSTQTRGWFAYKIIDCDHG